MRKRRRSTRESSDSRGNRQCWPRYPTRFSVSRRMRNIPDPSSSNTPLAVMLCSTSAGSFFPPRSASTAMRSRKPPSSAGSGRMLTTARLMLMTDANWYRPLRSDPRMTSAPTPTIAIGPLTLSFAWLKLDTSENSDLHTRPVSRPNSFVAKNSPSAGLPATRFLTSAFASSCTPIRPSPFTPVLGTTSTSTGGAVDPPRSILSRTGLEPAALTLATTSFTDRPAAGNASPSIAVMTSPTFTPYSLAADVLSSCATLTPGLYACSTNPTVFTWKFNIASAKATLAATPAEMTIALSLMGRFLSRSGSSWGYGQSGSSSGKATNPPSGTHRSEYSTSGPL
mmetsp:Transcript_11545/g.49755  ORF Transcript_11545/g.49755 Transcript_11545/m.49755 type:complete len:339 (-) Transcript_11545:593-1609(-)